MQSVVESIRKALKRYGFQCMSAMWYPMDKEQNCLLNSETMKSRPNLFISEDTGHMMVYFEHPDALFMRRLHDDVSTSKRGQRVMGTRRSLDIRDAANTTIYGNVQSKALLAQVRRTLSRLRNPVNQTQDKAIKCIYRAIRQPRRPHPTTSPTTTTTPAMTTTSVAAQVAPRPDTEALRMALRREIRKFVSQELKQK
ncbi:hypothetical protein OSTOST_11785, partial [Ostertagia ostertagi]